MFKLVFKRSALPQRHRVVGDAFNNMAVLKKYFRPVVPMVKVLYKKSLICGEYQKVIQEFYHLIFCCVKVKLFALS